MQVQINTDKNIELHEPLKLHIETVVKDTLGHFTTQISRVEVHLSDENAHKSKDSDKRCLMEARLQGRQPVAVTEHAATEHQAIQGAADKLKRAIDHTVGRLNDSGKGQVPVLEAADDLNE